MSEGDASLSEGRPSAFAGRPFRSRRRAYGRKRRLRARRNKRACRRARLRHGGNRFAPDGVPKAVRNRGNLLAICTSVFRLSRLVRETHALARRCPNFAHRQASVQLRHVTRAAAHEGAPTNNETRPAAVQAIPLVCEGLPADNEASLSEREGAALEHEVPRCENGAARAPTEVPAPCKRAGLRNAKRAPRARGSHTEHGWIRSRSRTLGGRHAGFVFGEPNARFRDEGIGGRHGGLRGTCRPGVERRGRACAVGCLLPLGTRERARRGFDSSVLSGALGDAVGADMHALYKFVTALEAGCAWEAPARFDELSGEQQSVIGANESFPGEGRIWLRQIDPQR